MRSISLAKERPASAGVFFWWTQQDSNLPTGLCLKTPRVVVLIHAGLQPGDQGAVKQGTVLTVSTLG
jgi:hypothetical protein